MKDILGVLALFALVVLIACAGILIAVAVDLINDRRRK